MNKEDNQFMAFAENLKNMTKDKQQLFYAGTIISISPLIIDIGELQLDREDLLINKNLFKNAKRKVKITEHGSSLNKFTMQDGEIENLEDIFKVNDKVILITNDQQLFVLLCIVG